MQILYTQFLLSLSKHSPDTSSLCNWFSDCLLFIQSNWLNCTVFIGVVTVPLILILWSNISDLLNPMEDQAKQKQELDLIKKILAKNEPERHHIDIAFTCNLQDRLRPKWYLLDNNEFSCQRLKQLYPQQTAVLQAQIIHGTLRHYLKVPNNSLQVEASNAPLTGL